MDLNGMIEKVTSGDFNREWQPMFKRHFGSIFSREVNLINDNHGLFQLPQGAYPLIPGIPEYDLVAPKIYKRLTELMDPERKIVVKTFSLNRKAFLNYNASPSTLGNDEWLVQCFHVEGKYLPFMFDSESGFTKKREILSSLDIAELSVLLDISLGRKDLEDDVEYESEKRARAQDLETAEFLSAKFFQSSPEEFALHYQPRRMRLDYDRLMTREQLDEWYSLIEAAGSGLEISIGEGKRTISKAESPELGIYLETLYPYGYYNYNFPVPVAAKGKTLGWIMVEIGYPYGTHPEPDNTIEVYANLFTETTDKMEYELLKERK